MPHPVRPHRAPVASLLAAGLVLSGCGLESDAGDAVDGPYTLGFVNGGTTRFHTCLQESVEQITADNRADVLTANSRQDATTELANIEDMIARKVDAITVQTADADALKDDIARATSAKVPIFLTSVVPDDTSGILGALVVDLKHVGALDAGWIEKDADAVPSRSVSSPGHPEPRRTCSWAVSPRRCRPPPRSWRTSPACSTPVRRAMSPQP